MSILVKVNTKAGDARMHRDVAPRFDQLRFDVHTASGVDFLAVCGDVLRPAGLKSNKPGVAFRSWHKTGRAFDYDQNSRAIVIVSDVRSGKQFFRTYLVCAKQDGSLGEKKRVLDMRGYYVDKYLVDFTAMAEAAGFTRIPAWNGWRKQYNYREFWHYQMDQGLTWDAAMQQLKGGGTASSKAAVPPAASVKTAVAAGMKIIGLNDRDSNTGGRVTVIQKELNKRGLLSSRQIDGIYGKFSLAAVRAFQRANALSADGTVGPLTAAKLGITL